MTRIPVGDIHLNVEVAGDGPPLVLLHGFTGSAATWAPFMDAFSRIRTVVAVDLLGHGRSDSPSDPARYRVERQLADFAALFTRLDIGRCDLLGYSMGGRLALHVALAMPGRVGALILESASPGIVDPAERVERIAQDAALAADLERDKIVPFVDRWERLPLFASQQRLDPAILARQRAQRLASNPVGLAGSLRGFGAGVPSPLHARLPELGPTLLIAGALDAKYQGLAAQMGETMARATVAVVPDAGHAVHLEQPEVFREIAIRYLEEASIPRCTGIERDSYREAAREAATPPREQGL